MSSKGRYLIGLAAAILVAGCVEPAPPPELRTSNPIQTDTPGAPGAAAPPVHAALPPHKAATPPPEVPSGPDAAATPTVATQGIEHLVGLDEAELQTVLGPPMLQEEKAPTKLWVFRSRNCTINVTLSPDVVTRQFHALAYEVISDVHTAERTRQCVSEFSARFSQR